MAFLASMDRRARIGALTGALLLLACTIAGLWWVLSPSQQLLFGNLRQGDAAEIVKALNEWKVPHRIVADGSAITVPSDLVYETRMKLVSEGVPRGGHVGFELFDDADFGVTEFAQRVNYQRALQGEIERTIASLPAVEDARVHLTIRRPGLFVGQQEGSKASVALSLRPGETLDRQQVGGIRSLVAAAVEGLAPGQVAVLDSDGTLLAGPHDAGQAPALDERSDEEARLEGAIQSRISGLLGQVLHSEQYKVSVDVVLNFDSVHEVSETPIGQGDDGNGLLARKRVNSNNATAADGRDQNEEESEFVHGTARKEISRAPGRIERLSIAVILPSSLDDFEMPRIQALIAAAAGIDPARGDQLEVSRLGPQEPLQARSEPVMDGVSVTASGVAQGEILPADGSNLPWTQWLPMLAAGLLLGAILAIATQKRPRALKAMERDAALAKMRAWLAEGDAS
jgi:flagellar M-ring protein FliF